MYRAVGNDNEQQATMSETTYQKWNMTLFPHQTSNMPCHGAETDLCAHSHRPATWHLLHPRTRSSWAQARPPLPSFARGAPVSSRTLLARFAAMSRKVTFSDDATVHSIPSARTLPDITPRSQRGLHGVIGRSDSQKSLMRSSLKNRLDAPSPRKFTSANSIPERMQKRDGRRTRRIVAQARPSASDSKASPQRNQSASEGPKRWGSQRNAGPRMRAGAGAGAGAGGRGRRVAPARNGGPAAPPSSSSRHSRRKRRARSGGGQAGCLGGVFPCFRATPKGDMRLNSGGKQAAQYLGCKWHPTKHSHTSNTPALIDPPPPPAAPSDTKPIVKTAKAVPVCGHQVRHCVA